MKLNNKAALFGFDARVALAIFVFASVSATVYLSSSISTSEARSFIYESKEVAKAMMNYQTDTGASLPYYNTDWATSNNIANLQELAESSLTHWAGPYIVFEMSSVDMYSVTSKLFGNYSVLRIEPTDFRGSSTQSQGIACSSFTNCKYVLQTNINDIKLMNNINKIIDNDNSLLAGLIQEKDGYLYYVFSSAEYEGI